MRKYIFLLSLITMWSMQVSAVDSVRINPDVEFVATGFTNITFPLNSVKPSADPSTETAQGKVYVPMDGPQSEADYFIERGVNAVFQIIDNNNFITLPLFINVGPTEKFLYVAVREGSNPYKIAKQFSTSGYTNATNQTVPFTLSPKQICDQLTTACTFTGTTGSRSTDAYFFLSTSSGTALGSTVDPTAVSFSGGAFFEINMSNKIYTSAEVTPVITSLRPGDKRLILQYTSNAAILEPKSVRIFRHDGAPAQIVPEPIKNYYNSPDDTLLPTEYSYANAGSVTIADLENNTPYNISILFVDQYKYATVLSLHKTETPLEIQELLKKQSCFLLTAGFGEEHFIIDYFRHFRDAVLSHSFLGRKFISAYYEHAPKYALMIYENGAVRTVIRGAAYVLYFLFNYFAFILITSMTLLAAIYLYKNKEKIKI